MSLCSGTDSQYVECFWGKKKASIFRKLFIESLFMETKTGSGRNQKDFDKKII